MATVLDEYNVVPQVPAPGGMGLVYRAMARTGDVIALKVVPIGLSADSEAIVRSERRGAEVQQLLGEKDAHVPRVYAFGEKHGVFFIEMEYIAGEDLSTVLAREGTLPPLEAARIAHEVASFLDTAHQTIVGPELVHSDIKPANIRIVHGTQEIKILDFGIARAGWHTATTNHFGSLPYMSPERIEGRTDRHADYWALGVVFYEMLAGHVPFRVPDGPSQPQRLQELILGRRPPLPLPESAPLALQAIVWKLLQGELGRRYQNAAALKADLAAVLAGETPVAVHQFRRPYEGDTIIVAPVAPVPPLPDATSSVKPSGRHVRRSRRPSREVVLACLIATAAVALDACAVRRASHRLATSLRQDSGIEPDAAWSQYERINRWKPLPVLTRDARSAVKDTLVGAADRVLADFRSDAPAVRAARWESSRRWLERAVSLDRSDLRTRARLRCVDGHLLRIDGESRRSEAQRSALLRRAEQQFDECARLDVAMPDPYIGLARIYSVGLVDFERVSQAVEEAERRGHPPGRRGHAQLGDALRSRAERFRQSAARVRGLPEEMSYLRSAADDYEQALAFYSNASGFGLVAENVRLVRRRLDQVWRRLAEVES
jgi:serine/threonine-protein kinase